MHPNFFHPASSSVSWQQQQQQQRNKGPTLPFPYHHHYHHQKQQQEQQQYNACEEGKAFRNSSAEQVSQQHHFELMNKDSSSPSNINYNEGEEIDDNLALGRGSEGGGIMMAIQKEHMFDKVVTPSDVGKLNRLVIPKQHAEKYFPLDSSTNEKGLLLNFEDRNGKPWRFRYSYWNSSQSYVMTKGWSRFVKEKKLDAGDIVSFSRGVGESGKDRLFIDWRRRPDAPPLPTPPPSSLIHGAHQYLAFHPWNHPYYLHQQRCRDHHLQLRQMNVLTSPNPHQSHPSSYGGLMDGNPCPGSLVYFRSPSPQQMAVPVPAGVGIGMMKVQRGGVGIDDNDPTVFESVPVVQGKAAAKRLRLFGVNMECPISEDSDGSEPDIILSSTAVAANAPLPFAPHSHFSSSSSSSSSMRPYPSIGGALLQKMSSDKGKGSLSLNLDV